MRWYRKLYTGNQAHTKRFRMVSSIKHGKYMKDLFLLTLSANEENLLDIYPGYIYMQPYFMERDDLIVGLAIGKEEALELVRTIVDDVYQATGTTDVRQYFEKGMG